MARVDGRVRRGERNREAIVDAVLALVREERAVPSATAIAERAGVAVRSVFHHFPDMEGLLSAVAESQRERYWSVLESPDAGSGLSERIANAVGQRARLFEAVGDMRRVAIEYESRFPTLGQRLQGSRVALRRHLRQALQPELSALDRPAVEGIQAVGSFEAWEVLRRHQGLSEGAARTAVQTMIESAFESALEWATTQEE